VGHDTGPGGGQSISNLIQTISNLFELHSFQAGPSRAKKFEIKYDFEGFDKRNNFSYINFLRIEMDFD
jgi:hypothetical protein